MNAITFITCKRLSLFIETVTTLKKRCLDIDMFDLVIHYDDSSTDDDRNVMTKLLHNLFPTQLILQKYYEKESFETNKRSMEIMNRLQKDITLLGVKYIFHIEDDWAFIEDFIIKDGLDILKNNDNIGYIGYHYPYRNKIEKLFGGRKMLGDYWEMLYFSDRPICSNLFFDEEETLFHQNYFNVPDFWCYFINWPPYSFRPGIHDIEKINSIGNFDYDVGSVELEFAKKYVKKYTGYSHIRRKCVHSGEYYSAFNINNSQR